MNMQRKISCVMVFSLIISILSLVNVSALNIGDEMGDVLNTDIKTYINDNRIPSYNINGKAAVIIKDLINYGFDSVYDNATRTTTVTYNPKKEITPFTNFDESKGQVGTVAFKYVYTDIVAIVNGKKVESFNIKGNLAIFFGDLADYGTFAYDNAKRESRFATQQNDFHWLEYIISIAKVDNKREQTSFEKAPNGRYMRITFMYESDDKGHGSFVWKNLDNNLDKSPIFLIDSTGKTYEVLSYGTTEVTFKDGNFGIPENVKNIFFDFDVPANISIDKISINVGGEIISLSKYSE